MMQTAEHYSASIYTIRYPRALLQTH